MRIAYCGAWLGFCGLLITCTTDNTLIYNVYYNDPLFALIWGRLWSRTGSGSANHERSATTPLDHRRASDVNSNGHIWPNDRQGDQTANPVAVPHCAPACQAKLRVALLTNEVPPYRVPKYRDLATTPGWDFRVFTCVDRERHRLWKVSHDLPFTTRRSYSLSYVREIRHDHGHFAEQHEVHLPIGLVWDLWRL